MRKTFLFHRGRSDGLFFVESLKSPRREREPWRRQPVIVVLGDLPRLLPRHVALRSTCRGVSTSFSWQPSTRVTLYCWIWSIVVMFGIHCRGRVACCYCVALASELEE